MEKELNCNDTPPWWILMPEKGGVAVKNILSVPSHIRCERVRGSLEELPLQDFAGIALGDPAKKDIELLQREGFSWFQHFAVLPTPGKPRWFVCLENQRISAMGLNLYAPQHWYAKFAKKMAQKFDLSWLSAIGLSGSGGRLLVALRRPPALLQACEAWSGIKVSFFSFATGAGGPFQKATIQAVGENKKIALYVKIASTASAGRRIQNEARLLSVLNSDAAYACHVPDLLFSGKFKQYDLLAQSLLPGNGGPDQLNNLIVTFLSKLVTNARVPVDNLSFWRENKEKILANPQLAGYWSGVENSLCGMVIPKTIMHGDFAPWNILIQGDKVLVFDWESGEPEGLPFFDLFHYLLQYGFLVRHWSGKKALAKTDGLIKSALFQRYVERVNIDISQVRSFLEFYLIFTLSGQDIRLDPALQRRYFALLELMRIP